jgi:hypothetical protein
LSARTVGLGARPAATDQTTRTPSLSFTADGAQGLPPVERHGIIPDDKLFLWPSRAARCGATSIGWPATLPGGIGDEQRYDQV